jgi:hypothetical protein
MEEVNPRDLVVGTQYRIEHRQGLLEPRLGTFIQNFDSPRGIQSEFNNIIRPTRKEDPITRITFDNIDWIIYKSAKTIIAGQVARGLSGSSIDTVTGETRPAIPEDTAGIVHRFLTPGNAPRNPISGRVEFPERDTTMSGGARARTYLKRKVKKSRKTRKNKSKSRKNLRRK